MVRSCRVQLMSRCTEGCSSRSGCTSRGTMLRLEGGLEGEDDVGVRALEATLGFNSEVDLGILMEVWLVAAIVLS